MMILLACTIAQVVNPKNGLNFSNRTFCDDTLELAETDKKSAKN